MIEKSNNNEVEIDNEKANNENCVQEDELLVTQKKLEEYTFLLKRSQADFINYKNRITKDIQDIVFLKTKDIALEFIAIKDIMQLAKDHEENQDTKNALSILIEKINHSLNRLNIYKIELKEGVCDYNLCECVNVISTKNKDEDNKIIQIIEDGYFMNEKLIKPVKVIINKLEE